MKCQWGLLKVSSYVIGPAKNYGTSAHKHLAYHNNHKILQAENSADLAIHN